MSTLTICFIKKIKVMEKIKCILKLLYVINPIIFVFFITLFFLIKQIVRVDIKNQT
jgi:hypothetical protein